MPRASRRPSSLGVQTCSSSSSHGYRRAPCGAACACLEESMGRKIRLREAQRLGAERAVCARLEEHARRNLPSAAPARYGDFQRDWSRKVELYREFALRSPDEWRCRLKSRAPERRFLDLID